MPTSFGSRCTDQRSPVQNLKLLGTWRIGEGTRDLMHLATVQANNMVMMGIPAIEVTDFPIFQRIATGPTRRQSVSNKRYTVALPISCRKERYSFWAVTVLEVPINVARSHDHQTEGEQRADHRYSDGRGQTYDHQKGGFWPLNGDTPAASPSWLMEVNRSGRYKTTKAPTIGSRSDEPVLCGHRRFPDLGPAHQRGLID